MKMKDILLILNQFMSIEKKNETYTPTDDQGNKKIAKYHKYQTLNTKK